MKLILANDIGNDKMKIIEPGVEGVTKIPSAYKRVSRKPQVHETDVQKNVVNLLDQLLVHITSPSVRRDGLYMIGNRAIQTTEGVTNMDIAVTEKHTNDLPLINSLGYAAARAVQKEYESTKELPKVIDLEVYMSTAIPASQHNIETAKHLEDRFKEGHIVVVYVGKETVTVQVEFKGIKVTKEGIPALYSIFEAPSDMFTEFSKEYGLKGIDGSYFMNSKIMHSDIGSGTTEYIYSIGVNPQPDLCSGERRGVGHAIEEAISLMAEDRKGLNINRQQFANYIEKPDEYPKDHNLAVEHLKEARINQVDFILGDIEKRYSVTLASEPEYIAVYGGGSIEFKDDMYKELKEFADSVDAKVLWVPKKYAVNMNVMGLDILNKNMLFVEQYNDVAVV